MLQAEADACLPRNLVDQQRIGFDVADIAGIGALDPPDVGIIGVIVDIDHGREIVVKAEPPQLGKAGGKDFSLRFQAETTEILCARQRAKSPRVLEPSHQAAFLINEQHRAGRQRRNLLAKAANLLRCFDVVIVLSRPAAIIEQDDAAEAETLGKGFQPRRNGLAEEAENEEFADGHADLSGR